MDQYSGYKWLIDELVGVANRNVIANRIRQNGHSVRTNDSDDFPLSADEKQEKDLLLSLSPDARIAVAKMIERARRSAVHDIASFLEGEITVGKMSVFVGDQKLEDSPYASYHYDFTCRLEGDDWADLD